MGYRSNPTLLRLGKRLPWTANSFVKYDYSLEYSKHLQVYRYLNHIFKKRFFLSRVLLFSHIDFFNANDIYFINLHLFQKKLGMLKKLKFVWRFTRGKNRSLGKSKFLSRWRPWKKKARFTTNIQVKRRHLKTLINIYIRFIFPFLKGSLSNTNNRIYFVERYISKLVERSDLLNVLSQLTRQNSHIFLYFRKYRKLIYSLKNYILATLRIIRLVALILKNVHKPYVYAKEISAPRYKYIHSILKNKQITLLNYVNFSTNKFIGVKSPRLLTIYRFRKSQKRFLNFKNSYVDQAHTLLPRLHTVLRCNNYNYYEFGVQYLRSKNKRKSFKLLYRYYKRKNNRYKLLKYLTYLRVCRYNAIRFIFKRKLLPFIKILRKYLSWKLHKRRKLSNSILRIKRAKIAKRYKKSKKFKKFRGRLLRISLKYRKNSRLFKQKILKYLKRLRYFGLRKKYLHRKSYKLGRNRYKRRLSKKKFKQGKFGHRFKSRKFKYKKYRRYIKIRVPFKFKKFRKFRKFRSRIKVRKSKLKKYKKYKKYKNLNKYINRCVFKNTTSAYFYVNKNLRSVFHRFKKYKKNPKFKKSLKNKRRRRVRYLRNKYLKRNILPNNSLVRKYSKSNVFYKKKRRRFRKSKLLRRLLSNKYLVPQLNFSTKIQILSEMSALIKDLYNYSKLFLYNKMNGFNIIYARNFVLFHQLKVYYNNISKVLKHLWYSKITNILRSDIVKILGKPLILNYVNVARGSYHPDLISRFIVFRLLNLYRFGEVVFPLFKEINRNRLKSRIKGFMLICSGRLTRRQRASRRSLVINTVGLGKLSSKITYSFNTVQLRYGMSSIKLYVNYSDI